MRNRILALLSLSIPLFISHCKEDDPIIVEPEPEVVAVYDDTPYNFEYGSFVEPDFGDNPLTEQGVVLGRLLFYENLLSKDNSIACASCHVQANGFSDTNTLSFGVDGSLGKRQAMSIFNLAWHDNEFFWDGRAHLLRDQALMPIQDQLEMKETLDGVISKLEISGIYPNQFIRAFGDDTITAKRISLALEQFMKSIVSNQSNYDKSLAGSYTLTASEERGKTLFFSEYNPAFPDISGADCAHCHGGSNFDNRLYFNNGLDKESDQTDLGREAATNDPKDRAKFKVPSLRNVALTPPYMHDGRFSTLLEVVNHYDHGIQKSPTLNGALDYSTQTGLMLSEQDKQDLIAFLNTLIDPNLATDARYSKP
jgi:cytochrome c peroxidase